MVNYSNEIFVEIITTDTFNIELRDMEKTSARPLKKMFMEVPPSYDLLNRVLTFRFDERWRKQAVKTILQGSPEKVLDLCTGTGDLALRLRASAMDGVEVTALDYSRPMLEEAQRKARKRGITDIRFIEGDVAAMPFDAASFDAIGIAFAFRNLSYKNPDTEVFLKEILRVLQPGGCFVIVETSQPTNRLMRFLSHAYLKYITVPLGGMISGHRGAYHYLAHSAINYYSAEALKSFLLQAGFETVDYKRFLTGVAGMWTCKKSDH